jgi:translation initiation factor 4A
MTDTIIIKNWDDLNLKNDLLRGIYSYGFEKPSEIQQLAIYPIVQKKDVIAQAQSGTGKTGTFSISTLQTIDTDINECQAVIIAPTRELVSQISGVVEKLGTFMENLKVKTLVGGTSVSDDINALKNNTPQVVVGTPGRIFDMIRRRKLVASTVRLFILDEADEMLSYGFQEQIQTIFQYFNENVQTAIFSATMPDEIIDITKKFMNDPVKLTMKAETLSLDGIEQFFVATMNEDDKYNWLNGLFNKMNLTSTIIFVNDIQKVIDLYHRMLQDGFPVCHIHSSLTKEQRTETIDEFKQNKYHIMISSNLTARGIDIQQLNMVINYDIPNDVHTYLHRIGRSGRWGRKGTAINFVCLKDVQRMKRIETHYKINISELNL